MNPSEIKFIGTKQWQVVRMIGQGGMSWVFEVLDPHLRVARALKMLKPAAANASGYKRFLLEAQTLARIEDESLVRIYDLDKDPGTGNDYYVMELLSGSDLKQFLKSQGPLTPERAKAIFAGVLQALGKLHAQPKPIVHRDIKPGNIQITESGRPRLLDLGIAKVTRKNTEETVFGDDSTIADMFIGTVLYAAPEQLAMQEAAPHSDVFAMGLCIYEALEGHHAYSGVEGLPDPTSSHVLYQDVFRFYTRLEAIDGRLNIEFKRTPKPLQMVIRKALELEPRKRFSDANEMREALLNPDLLSARSTIEELVPPKANRNKRDDERPKSVITPEPTLDRGAREPESRQRPWWMPLAAVAIVACLAGAAYLATTGGEDTGPSTAAAADAGVDPVIDGTSDRPPDPPLDPRAATDAQRGAKDQAEERVSRAASTATAESARDLVREAQQVLQEADAAWAANEFATAAAQYEVATHKADEALAAPSGSTRTEQEVAIVRREAEAVNAAVNAASLWESGLAHQGASRPDDAYGAYAAARDGAQKALADAKQLQQRAQAGRRALSGSCAEMAGREALCREGEAALAQGATALAKLDGIAATQAFRVAARAFQASTQPLRVQVEPAGPIVLGVGEEKKFVAKTEPADAKAMFYVLGPGSSKPEGALTENNTFWFKRAQPGNYQITVRASDKQKRESEAVVIAVKVEPKVLTPNRPPRLTVTPSDPIARLVGELVVFKADVIDPDGGRAGIQVSCKGEGIEALPTCKKDTRRVGNQEILEFTPTAPGTYTYTFRAVDIEDAKSQTESRTVVVSAKPVVPPTPSTPEEIQKKLIAETIGLYEDAWMARDITEISRYRILNPQDRQRLSREIEESESIIATITPTEINVRASFSQATVRINQRIQRVVGGKIQDLYAGKFLATLSRDREGWVITSILGPQ